MAIILTKKSDTASSVPLVADLTNAAGGAELAVNTADKRLFTKTSGGTVVELGTNPSALTLPNGTANAVPYLNASKVLTSGSALTFDGSNFINAGLIRGSNLQVSNTNGLSLFDDIASGFLSYGYNSGRTNAASHVWYNGITTELMRLNSSGNLGLGVAPSAWLSTRKAIDIGGSVSSISGAATTIFYNNAYTNASAADIYKTTGSAAQALVLPSTGGFAFYTAPSGTAGNAITFTQAMTLDASGNLLVGKTAANNTDLGVTIYKNGTTSGRIEIVNGQAGGTAMQAFYYSSGAAIGSISGSNTTTAYNTSSDYRLKENVAPMTGALAKVAALKPVTYTWKADGSAGEGFIAHELAEVCPAAVTGEKDAVDAEGNPQYQGIDVSFLVGTLTAAIQELKAEFDAYKAAHP